LLLGATVASVSTGVMLPLMNVVFGISPLMCAIVLAGSNVVTGKLVGAFSDFYDPNSHESKGMFIGIINQNV
jgi:hypothetical protein